MSPARRTHRTTAWIAIFAILLAALAPGLARAFSVPQPGMPWSEICTLGGTASAQGTLPAQLSGQHEAAAFTHCPFCLNHAGQFVLPTAASNWLPALSAEGNALLPTATTPPARFIRTAGQPRAPPAHS